MVLPVRLAGFITKGQLTANAKDEAPRGCTERQ
jgi:hypothetical protein